MISRSQIISRLRDANYTFVDQKRRVEMWRQRGGVQHVPVPLRDFFTNDEAGIILRQAGLTPNEIKAFLASCIKH